MAKLDEHTTKTLVQMARQLYPHDFLGDVYYAKVVETVDEEAEGARVSLLNDGVKTLDGVFNIPFVDLSNGYKLKALKSIEGSDFFEDMRGATVRHLYNNPLVWRYFGYEGPSAHLGGYINRGFDDIAWIPDE